MTETAMEIIECKTKEEIISNFPILTQLYSIDRYPHMTKENFARLLPEMQDQGYRQVAAIKDGKTLAVAGFSTAIRLYLGKIMRINDIVVDESWRRQGIGAAIIDRIIEEARKEECVAIVLDTGIERKDTHRFYEREGFTIQSHHFIRRL